ncbi:MAG: ribosome maturation factor RimP [Bdellovibrionota bacterium]
MDRMHRDAIVEHINPLIQSLGYECLEVEWDGSDNTLRVFIDQPTGIVMDDCLAANRALIDDEALDKLVPHNYRLEISSPGVDRPLRTMDHFRSAIGKSVKIHLSEKHQERANGVGKLMAIDEENTFSMNMPTGTWTFPFKAIRKANLMFEWK